MSELTMKLLRLRAECWDRPRPEALSRRSLERFRAANARDLEAWQGVKGLADWEAFRDARMKALRASLGSLPEPREEPRVLQTGLIAGDGYRIEKIVHDGGRAGQPVTALLYLPDPLPESMAGILICHSHHHSKEQVELQDMGVSWARSGAAVLVPDMAGHGERSDNPFGGRQDYYGRYFSGMQLDLVGESLMGWMVADLRRGIDVLLGCSGVDPERLILVGAVAGGGDPVAVTAALDGRVKCSVPFNFGKACNWPKRMGASEGEGLNFCDSGSFEGTRNLRLSSRDGFLRWAIVAAVAPRPLVYAHEFEWIPEKDPVWNRLRKVYGLYGAEDCLATAHGCGSVKGPGGPENTHCTNVGPLHREQLYPAWRKWFGFEAEESSDRRDAGELVCMTGEARAEFAPQEIHRICARIGRGRCDVARARLGAMSGDEAREALQAAWRRLLGNVDGGEFEVETCGQDALPGALAERLTITTDEGMAMPVLLLRPDRKPPFPVVLGVSQAGKNCFLRGRIPVIAGLLERGAAVCLADVRGTGETCPDAERGREGEGNTVAADELMHGESLLGGRLRDLRTVIRWLREDAAVGGSAMVLWGASFSPVNPRGAEPPPQDGDGIDMRTGGGGPRGANRWAVAEPLGGLLALLGSLYESDVAGALLERDLESFSSMLDSVFCSVPLDCHVPGAIAAGDLGEVIARLGRPLKRIATVDGLNRAAEDAPGTEAGGKWGSFAPLLDWLLGALEVT